MRQIAIRPLHWTHATLKPNVPGHRGTCVSISGRTFEPSKDDGDRFSTKRKTPDELTAKIYMASLLSASLERAFSRQDRAWKPRS